MASPGTGWTRSHILMAVSIAAGWIGMDRFYQGQVRLGVVKLVTLGGLGVWWLADAVYYTRKAGESLK